MATDYYDISTTDCTSESVNITDTTDTSSENYTYTCSTDTNRIRVYKRVITPIPESWDEKVVRAYIILVNEKTSTGWNVTMLINGDIKIVDPNIEKRPMKDFIPLLKHSASNADRRRIDNFFERNPI